MAPTVAQRSVSNDFGYALNLKMKLISAAIVALLVVAVQAAPAVSKRVVTVTHVRET
jgi:hypothetical protein